MPHSDSRLPAEVSLIASLDSPFHSGSDIHATAWLNPF